MDGQSPVDRPKTIPLARPFCRWKAAPTYALVTVPFWLVCGDVTTCIYIKHCPLHFTIIYCRTSVWKSEQDMVVAVSTTFCCLCYLVFSSVILLMWRTGWAPNNASRWQMGFNSAFKGLKERLTWGPRLPLTKRQWLNCLSLFP